MLTEERLRERLHHYGDRLTREVDERPLVERFDPVAPIGRRRSPSWLVAAAVTVGVLLVGGAVWLAATGGETTRTTADPTTDPTETTIVTTTDTADPTTTTGVWLQPGGVPSGGEPTPGGDAAPVDPATLPGWTEVGAWLGVDADAPTVLRLPSGAVHVGWEVDGVPASLIVQRLDGPVVLPVAVSLFAAGFTHVGGQERYVGRADDGATLAQVVDDDGRSTTLTVGVDPDEAARLLGDLDAIVLAVHDLVGAW